MPGGGSEVSLAGGGLVQEYVREDTREYSRGPAGPGAEGEIQQLRTSLLQELRATKQVLLSSLRSLDALGPREERRDPAADLELLLSPPPGPTSPLSVASPSSGNYSATPSPGSELLARLRAEVDVVREERRQAAARWARERGALRGELAMARRGGGGAMVDRLKDILAVIRSLNTLDISDAALGRMVVEAVEAAYDPAAGEVAVFRFLALLYRSTREHERRAAGSLLARAMQAVGEDALEASDSSASSLSTGMPEGMRTLRPRRPRDTLRDMEGAFQINV